MAAAAAAVTPPADAADADSTVSSVTAPAAPADGKKAGAAGPASPADPAAAGASSRKAAEAATVKAVSTIDDTGVVDKHAHGSGGDSSAPGISGDGAAGLAQIGTNATAGTDAAGAPLLKVSAGVGTPEFGQSLADRVSWMVDNNLNGARLQVNPPQLGPIEVRIEVQGGHAQV